LISLGAVSYYVLQEYLDDKETMVALSEENGNLTDTTRSQAVMISELQHITGTMMTRIGEIESLSSEVRTKVGLEEAADEDSQVVAGYVVSRGESVQDRAVVAADEYMDTLEDLRQELMNMDSKMTEQAMELYYLKDDVDRQLAFEAALPSLWPMEGIFSSSFGMRKDPLGSGMEFHEGIDIANKIGIKIYAAGDGVVTFAGTKSGWGRMVLVSHGYGYVSQYAHCNTLEVLEGQTVKKGDVVATCGNTGRVTGPHLHFGIQLNGTFIDPMKVLITGGGK
jgi:murein DD-endopeptidase MepM/ murein hydrolase activator NlpD